MPAPGSISIVGPWSLTGRQKVVAGFLGRVILMVEEERARGHSGSPTTIWTGQETRWRRAKIRDFSLVVAGGD